MIHGAANPLMILRDRQIATGLLMLPERAMNRHKAVAQKLVAQATSLAPHGRCNREALDALRKRDGLPRIANELEPVRVLPIAIEQIAITKIGNACAANAREMGKGRCVTACFEREMKPLAAALMGAP